MGVSQSALGVLYLYAFFLGVLLGAVYDVLRITRVFLGVHYSYRMADRLRNLRLPLLPSCAKRRESRALGIVVFVEDLLFCLLAGVLLVLLFYEKNHGIFRFPVFLCAGGGFLLYRVTVGRGVMLFSQVIAFGIECAVRYLLFFLAYPWIRLMRMGKRLLQKLIAVWKEKRKRRLRVRFTKWEYQRLPQLPMVPTESAEERTEKKKKKGRAICIRNPKNSSA